MSEGIGSAGLFAQGRLVSVSPVRYGANHATKPGEAVPGLFEIVLDVTRSGDEEPRAFKASYFEESFGQPARIMQDIADADAVAGDVVRVRVGVQVKKGGQNGEFVNVNYTAQRFEKLSAADSSLRSVV